MRGRMVSTGMVSPGKRAEVSLLLVKKAGEKVSANDAMPVAA